MPGGTGGQPFTDDPDNRILERIYLRIDPSGLHSIQSAYTDKSTGTKHGGSGGTSCWFDLNDGEAITAVYIWADSSRVTAIQFRMNKGRLSPKYGSGKGAPFIMRQKVDGKPQAVAGFKGRDDKQINQLDIIWSERIVSGSRYMRTTESRGKAGVTDRKFNDMLSLGDPTTAVISRIVIRHGGAIDSIKVYYASNNTECPAHGGAGGSRSEFTLGADEFITKIEGLSTNEIVQLTFVTNKRRLGPYGHSGGETFVWDASEGVPSHLAPYMRLLCFSGTSDNLLKQLRATFAEYSQPQNNPGKVIYEGSMQENNNNFTPATSSLPERNNSAAPLSKFALHLMAPVITLFVGQERTEFRAYEDVLCQLPFFRAALRGEFKEASEKTISLPEDDPSKVSALVEFLYTGNYTYAYKTREARPQEVSRAPAGDLTEGLFHIGVYATASKYDCQELVSMALKSFKGVLDVLDEIDTLRFWKAAYTEGIRLQDQKSDTGQGSHDDTTMIWVSWLFENQREEMEATMAEYPALSCDLLRLAAAVYWD